MTHHERIALVREQPVTAGASSGASVANGAGSSELVATLAVRERYRDEYWQRHDPIAKDRLLWRAQTFRHTLHLLPGQTILELGCGSGMFTRPLLRTTRRENPLTTVTFQR